MNILGKYDIEKDELEIAYDSKYGNFSAFKNGNRIEMTSLNRRSWNYLTKLNLEYLSKKIRDNNPLIFGNERESEVMEKQGRSVK